MPNKPKNIPQIEKVVLSFLRQENLHPKKVLEIKNETIETYDGLYPSFEIIYEGGHTTWIYEHKKNLINSLENYTGLKHNTDFWLGVSFV